MSDAIPADSDERSPTRKWGNLIASAPIIVIIAGCLLFGKTRLAPTGDVRQWIGRLGGPDRELARQELRGMGAAALPALSSEVTQTYSGKTPASAYGKLWVHLPKWATKRLPAPEEFIRKKLVAREADFVAREILANLAANGGRAGSALPVLEELVTTTNSPYRITAARIMWDLRGQPAGIIPLLDSLLSQPTGPNHLEAVKLAAKLGPAAVPLAQGLARYLNDPWTEVAETAADALGAIGPGARLAVPELEAAASSATPSTRLKARTSLGLVDPAALQSLLQRESSN